jgi:hypothetical protein
MGGGNQNRLFYSFSLEDHVPADHLLRGIDQFLDLEKTSHALFMCLSRGSGESRATISHARVLH